MPTSAAAFAPFDPATAIPACEAAARVSGWNGAHFSARFQWSLRKGKAGKHSLFMSVPMGLFAHAQRTLESIARESGMYYESFRKKFRAITGGSPGRYRNRLAVDLARQMIYEERLSNKQLAERLVFWDEFHFSCRFRQFTGQSTLEFRRSLPKGSR